MARLSFRCSDDLLGRVDEARGLVPRETWCRMEMVRAVERALGEASGGHHVLGPTLKIDEADLRRALEPLPTSRPFTPYPKGGK